MAEKNVDAKSMVAKNPEMKGAAEKNPADKSAAKNRPSAQAKSGKAQNAAQKEDEFADAITSPFGQWWDYIKANFKKCYLTLLTIGLLVLIVSSAFKLVSNLVSPIAMQMFQTANFSDIPSLALLAAGVLVFLLFGFFISWLAISIPMASIVFINSEFARQPFGIWSAVNAIRGKAFRFMVVNIAIALAMALPLIIVAVLLFLAYSTVLPTQLPAVAGVLAPLVLGLLGIIAFVYLLVVNLVFQFLAQFWQYGFIVQGLGVVDALKQSVAIVRRKPFECLIFDIVLGVLTTISLIPTFAVSFGAAFVSMLISLLVIMFLPSDFIVLVMSLVSLAVSIITLVFATIAECVSLPIHYLFWKNIKAG